MLAWAALLHDIGKPDTFFKDDNGVEHFYGHDRVGAKIAEDILKRLRFSNDEIEAITLAVKNHMKFVAAPEMKTSTWKKFVREKYFPLYLALHKLDALASNGYLGFYDLMKQRYEEFRDEPEIKTLITGKDLIKLGLKPGKKFKKILNEILDLQLEGKINSSSDAINYVKENYL
jgi:poly(A) polymerase